MQETVDRSNIESFVEKNAEYYVEKWATMNDGSSSRVSGNWAAAIGGLVWMLYRKLYIPIAIVIPIVIADAYMTMELADAGVFPSAVAFWDKLSYWIYAAIYGSWGNYWYLQKFRNASDGASRQFTDTNHYRDYLAQKGGTSIGIAGAALLLLSALVIWDFWKYDV